MKDISQDTYMLPRFRGELFFALALKDFAQQLKDINLPNVNLQKEIATIENLRKSFLQDSIFNMLSFIFVVNLNYKTYEDTAIEKAEAAVQKIIKEMPMAGQ